MNESNQNNIQSVQAVMPPSAQRKKQRPAVTRDMLNHRLFLTVREFGELASVPPQTVYVLARRGQIPGVRRFGNGIRIAVSALM